MPETFSGTAQRHPFMLLALIGLALAEVAWLAWRRRSGYDWRESGTSMAIAAGNALVRPLNALLLAPVFAWVYAHRVAHIEVQGPLAFAALVIAVDFIYYVFHRCSHRLRWMWATHGVHHSSTQMNLSAAYRLGWTELLSGSWLFLLLPVALGVPPVLVLAAFALNLAYQFLLHSRLIGRLGVLERVFNTPAHHRVHHAINEGLVDRNFGGILIIWDHLFGTFAAAGDEVDLRFGVIGQTASYNPLRIVFLEWQALFGDLRAAPDWRQRLRVLSGTSAVS
ncbi:sterol desaturase family protein [Solimonas terrae]|uniref:Sterol desaturase family protein n=1 Tax=Solimonas terrae TaxID=1396819 RepID=A0A6M2BP92_9GAMM|nr:sterol desaturase family protein [Solimonas terrae]NGY03889.1 sterol desaturase family protein [Solimonas terrae]